MYEKAEQLVKAGIIPESLLALGGSLAEHFREHWHEYDPDTRLQLEIRNEEHLEITMYVEQANRFAGTWSGYGLRLDNKGNWHIISTSI